MLLGMTGFGTASVQNDDFCLSVEIRTVNNRYLKIAMKTDNAISLLENRIDKLLRESIARGTVSVAIRMDRLKAGKKYLLNQQTLQSYWTQLHDLSESLHVPARADLAALLDLPGVIEEETHQSVDADDIWGFLQECLKEALMTLTEFRQAEGNAAETDLRLQLKTIQTNLEQITQLAPQVVETYRDRTLARVTELLAKSDVNLDAAHLIREVSIFADRCDINEEITRLQSHLEQFGLFLNQEKSQGRKLDFLTQEMNREVNTIGSKANHVGIAHHVVDMKAAVEKIRENLQNVE